LTAYAARPMVLRVRHRDQRSEELREKLYLKRVQGYHADHFSAALLTTLTERALKSGTSSAWMSDPTDYAADLLLRPRLLCGRITTRHKSRSRTGLNALGIHFDEAYGHIAGLNLNKATTSRSSIGRLLGSGPPRFYSRCPKTGLSESSKLKLPKSRLFGHDWAR
jgi:hypothetical protein